MSETADYLRAYEGPKANGITPWFQRHAMATYSREVVERLPGNTMKVLLVGCASAYSARGMYSALKEAGDINNLPSESINLRIIDVREEAINAINAEINQNNFYITKNPYLLDVSAQVMDARNLDGLNGQYHMVVSDYLLNFVPRADLPTVISQMYGVTAEGGVLVATFRTNARSRLYNTKIENMEARSLRDEEVNNACFEADIPQRQVKISSLVSLEKKYEDSAVRRLLRPLFIGPEMRVLAITKP